MKKKCFKCGKEKELEMFYKHPATADKHLNKCILCTKKDVQKRYNDDENYKKIQEYERLRFKTPERKKKLLEYIRKRVRIHSKKYGVHSKVHNAIKRGDLIKLPCEVCGEIKVQAHHPDYRSLLRVMWLCFKHHRELHGQKIR